MSERTPDRMPMRLAAAGLAAMLAIVPAACGRPAGSNAANPVEFRGATMGTRYHVKAIGLPPGVTRDALGREVETALARVNQQMSTYLPDSEISRFNRTRSADWFAVSAATAEVVAAALDLSRLTDGAFDVTVGPLVRLWGFGPETCDPIPPADQEVARERARVGWRHLEARLDPPALRKRRAEIEVDLSAIAKGFGVDRVGARLDAAGVAAWLVEIGGEVRVRGRKPDGSAWRIGVEAPRADRREVLERLAVTDRAVATSGDYRIFFEHAGQRYGHALDPRTGRPVSHRLASVTVVASSCLRADGLATALLVLGPEAGPALAARHGIAALFLIHDGEGLERRETPAFAAAVRETPDD